MSGTRADKRKAREANPHEGCPICKEARERQPAAMLTEAARLERRERVLRCLQQVYFGAEWPEGDALADALEDEGLLALDDRAARVEVEGT